MMREIIAGDAVTVMTYDQRAVRRRALTGVVQGHDFQVVWVCDESEYQAARRQGREAVGVPWPSEAVRSLTARHVDT